MELRSDKVNANISFLSRRLKKWRLWYVFRSFSKIRAHLRRILSDFAHFIVIFISDCPPGLNRLVHGRRMPILPTLTQAGGLLSLAGVVSQS